ncbi:hypothetical protein ES319_D01G087500v1 [Gossypium barbadense]|uniref:Uncharacterized protein n=2 Tax=Gossypium TaxID=3633 RepID=A0A5J5SLC0_GOSBA|nr:hypothetical protein ES319_D01G087500v1 [Gossypium barbadense]TYG82533.1 hypothetical protein ES288_D01G096400v1 [Gossypium darwinii]
MGSRCSCLGQSSPQRLSDQQETEHENEHKASSWSVLCLLMLVCMWKNEAKERQLLQVKEKQQQKQVNKAKKEPTLEDWLIASPGLQKINGTTSGGEYHVFKHYSSKRVFPSCVGENENGSSSSSSSSKARGSFSKERLLKGEESEVSFSMTRSGKSKKRVSFRLPEEDDIFIFHSSSPEAAAPE